MKQAVFLGSLALLLQQAPAQAADQPRILAPSSDWTLDFADERCSLIREFSDGTDKLRLQIDSFGPMQGYRVVLSGDPVPRPFPAPILEIGVAYSPDTRERAQFGAMAGKFGDVSAVSFRQGFLPDSPPTDPAQIARERNSAFERSVTHLTVQFGSRQPLRLDTGNMAAPFAAMHRCVDDLVGSWGIDPAQQRTLSQPVRVAELAEGWEKLDTAPLENRPGYSERRARVVSAAFARNGELVPVRVMVDATGTPTACVVQVPFASDAYRQAVCEARTGDRYQPALDAAGRPVASFIQFETR